MAGTRARATHLGSDGGAHEQQHPDGCCVRLPPRLQLRVPVGAEVPQTPQLSDDAIVGDAGCVERSGAFGEDQQFLYRRQKASHLLNPINSYRHNCTFRCPAAGGSVGASSRWPGRGTRDSQSKFCDEKTSVVSYLQAADVTFLGTNV